MTERKTITTSRVESGFWAFVWRHRVGLAPLIVGSGVGLLGPIVRWIFLLDITLAAIVYAAFGVIGMAFTFWASHGNGEARWHRKRSQEFTGIVISAALVWLLYFHNTSTVLEIRTAYVWLLVATTTLALPYWFNLRFRTRVKLDNMIDEWPALTAGTSMAKTRLSTFEKTANGWKATLTWEKGALSRRRVKNEPELIESLMDAPPDSVSFDDVVVRGKIQSNAVHVTCVEDDPHDKPIPFDGVIADSIRDSVNIGKYADFQEENTAWWEDGVGGFHRLLGGTTRSGKSGLMHLLVAKYSGAEDVAYWFIDLKGGTALLPWAPLADWVATEQAPAVHMLMGGACEVDRRAKICAAKGDEVWTPTEDDPVIIIYCDEIASIVGDSAPNSVAQPARSAMVEIARKGAGMGVLLVPATQYPTLGALGDSQLKSQLNWRACFRLAQPEQGQYVLPSMPSSVDPYRIPKSRRGTCYIDAEGEFRPAPLRVQFVDRPDIRPIVERFARTRHLLDGIEDGWANEGVAQVYRDRVRWTIDHLETLRSGGTVEHSEATGNELYDLDSRDGSDDMDDDATYEEDVMGEHEPHTSENVIAVDFTGYAGSELRNAVDEAHRNDPQMAEREAKEREAYLASRRPVPANEVERIMFDALAKAGDEGVGPGDLAALTNRSERTIHRYLERMKDEGKVVRLGWGRYKLLVQPART